MRLLYLTPGCFDKGGISRYSRYQISALREIFGPSNVRVVSLLGPGEDSLEDPFGVDWHGRGEGGQASIVDRAGFVGRVLGLAASWRPDVVHSAHVNFGPLVSVAGRIARAKGVLNVYGLEIWSGLSAWRRAHMARAGSVIADCHFTGAFVTREGLHADRPTVIWDCVDLDRFYPAAVNKAVLEKYGIPDPARHFIVLSLGRLAKAAAHKGFDRLIEVVSRLAPELPDLRLVIAGRGDDRGRLEQLADSLGIGELVVFTGSVEEGDLADIYRTADVFSLVSDRAHGRGEGIPLTPLEAMACGVPVIVGDEDGSQEAVVLERNGFVVSPRDGDALGGAIERLAQNPGLLSDMRLQARRVAEENFSYREFVEKHRAFYGSARADGPAQSRDQPLP